MMMRTGTCEKCGNYFREFVLIEPERKYRQTCIPCMIKDQETNDTQIKKN